MILRTMEQHNYQWSHTDNALAAFSDIVNRNLENDKDRLHKIFLETPCFATEKYDGANIAKDEDGCLYSRRLILDREQDIFNKTDLKDVKKANVLDFKKALIEVADFDTNLLKKCLVYGEFICNKYYDYVERNIMGNWQVFGAVLEIEKDYQKTLGKLLSSGFLAKKKTEKQLQIICNKRFIDVAESVGLNTPKIIGENAPLADILLQNKDLMKKGLVEGLILTIQEEGSRYKTVKWKGAHEFQPASEEKALDAVKMINSAGVHENLENAFACISEVITDTTENKYVTNKKKADRRGKSSKTPKENVKKTQKGKSLSAVDREIILNGITHCQKKFDCVEEYTKKGQESLDCYITNLVREVRIHLAEEKGDFTDVDKDDRILGFIQYKVKETIKSQLVSSGSLMCSDLTLE